MLGEEKKSTLKAPATIAISYEKNLSNVSILAFIMVRHPVQMHFLVWPTKKKTKMPKNLLSYRRKKTTTSKIIAFRKIDDGCGLCVCFFRTEWNRIFFPYQRWFGLLAFLQIWIRSTLVTHYYQVYSILSKNAAVFAKNYVITALFSSFSGIKLMLYHLHIKHCISARP